MCSWEPFLEDPNNLTSPLRRGALGPIRNRKPKKKIILSRKTEEKNHPEPKNRKKNSMKTENRTQNYLNRYIFTSQLLKPWSIRYSGDKWSIQSKLH